jgi:glycosyltransferase involved in cell wall biosynthesis
MAPKQISDLSIAVLVPCYNEGTTIEHVVTDFKAALPDAKIYVYDNRSTDDTFARAARAGAIVRREERPGKGEVVRRMFGDIEADIYVMVDGDATYHAASAPTLIDLMLKSHADLVNGARVDTAIKAYRLGHRFGNRLLTGLVSAFFGQMTTDMLSGYKIFSRRFVKSFPAHSRGFEIETELMVHALELRMTIKEQSTPYAERPEGSISKLNTIRDGIRILSIIGLFVREERPLAVFSLLGLILSIVSLALGLPVVAEFLQTGLVSRFPTAILASALMITAVISIFSGLVLDTVTRGRREAKRFAYLAARDRRFE